MNLLNDIGKKISKTAINVTKKSESIVEITKLNLAIGNEEDKIKRMFTEIGSELYRNFLNGQSHGDLFDDKCMDIRELEENIEKLREKVMSLKGTKSCEGCNTSVDSEAKYCSNCGSNTENN